MTYYILTKNGRANHRLEARLRSMGIKYKVEKIDIGEYIYTVNNPDKERWSYLKDMIGTDTKDFVFNEQDS